MSLIKRHESRYILETVRGAKKTNVVAQRGGDSHYRVYPQTVEFYVATPEQQYLMNPDDRQNVQLGRNHFWNL